MSRYKDLINYRNITVGNIYMFPRYGFSVIDVKTKERSYIDTNPFTKSLDQDSFKVKEIRDGICIGNFYNNPVSEDFGIDLFHLKQRDFVEKVFIALIVIPIIFVMDKLRAKKD